VDSLTPVQQRTLDELMARELSRPVFPADLAERLRERIAEGIGALGFEQPLWISKHKLTDHGRCEGLFAANLLGEGDPFEHRLSTAAGALAHKAVEIDVGRERADASAELVDRAAERLVETEGTFASYWDGLDPLERSEVCAEAIRMVEQFRASFPPLQKSWTPVTEWPVRVEFGDVVLSGRVDLMLGRENPDAPMQARRIAMDLKSGRAWPEFPEDMRLYALILTLRIGVPPFRVASVFLESGEWQSEDVDERTLFHAADRLVRGVQAAARLLDGGEPELTPGGYCSWCPRRVGCPAADAAAAQEQALV
jgi:hypothetical protein